MSLFQIQRYDVNTQSQSKTVLKKDFESKVKKRRNKRNKQQMVCENSLEEVVKEEKVDLDYDMSNMSDLKLDEEVKMDSANDLIDNSTFTVLGSDDVQRPTKIQHVPAWIKEPQLISALENETELESISGLSKKIIKKLRANGIRYFFPAQTLVIPEILRSCTTASVQNFLYASDGYTPRDICCAAPTGSGKTLSFVVPLVQILAPRLRCEVRAIILLPVRELAVQVHSVFQTYTEGTELRVALLAGVESVQRESASLVTDVGIGPPALRYQCAADIVVATPGRLVTHIHDTDGLRLDQVRFLVIDEADRVMDEMKFGWWTTLLEALEGTTRSFAAANSVANRSCPSIPLQKLLFSATLSRDPEKLEVLNLNRPLLFSAYLMDSSSSGAKHNQKYVLPSTLTEKYILVTASNKPLVFFYLIIHLKYKNVLCFTNSLRTTTRLKKLAKIFGGMNVESLFSKVSAGKRKSILKRFRRGEFDALICSDMMARGMDLDSVAAVVAYDTTKHIETYIHRVGRTARAGAQGVAISLLQSENVFHFQRMMQRADRPKVTEMKIPKKDLAELMPKYESTLKELQKQLTEGDDH